MAHRMAPARKLMPYSAIPSCIDPAPSWHQWGYQSYQSFNTSAKKAPRNKQSKTSELSQHKRKKTGPSPPSSGGRVVLHQSHPSGKNRQSGKIRLCAGCGSQVVSSNKSGIAGGQDAIDHTMSKRQAKLSRFMDVMDASGGGAQGFLCERCKSLQSDDIWSAYDALRDVEPNVFLDQLKLIVSRRRFGLCIVVVDVTDSEHTAVRNLRDAIGKTGAVLVWNKVDLLPRFGSHEKRAFEKKLKNFSFLSSFACSAETGYGLGSLAQFILERLGGRDVFCVGAANVGKSTLVKKLSEMIAQTVYLKGSGRQANRRRELTSSLKVTGLLSSPSTQKRLYVCLPPDAAVIASGLQSVQL